MYITGIIIIGILSLIDGIYKRDICHPIVLFNVFWCVIAIGASLHLYSMKVADMQIYKFILIGMLAFTIGTLFPQKVNGNRHSYEINTKLLYIMLTLSFTCLILLSLNSLKYLLLGYSFSDIRYELQGEILSNKHLHRIYKFIVVPFGLTLLPIWAWEVISNKGKNKKIVMGVLIYQALCFTVEAATHFIYNLFIVFVFCGFIYLRKRNMSSKYKKKIFGIAVLLILGYVALRTLRGSSNGICKNLYTYFTCGIPFFSEKLKANKIFANQTYGITSVQGIIRPIMGVLELFGFENTQFNEATNFILSIQNEAVKIIPDKYFNFFITCFAYFYKDFGITGIVLFSMLWGYFEKKLYMSLDENFNIRSLSLYLLGVVAIFLSMMHFFASESETVWAFFYLIMITKRGRKCIVNENLLYSFGSNEEH